MADLEEFRQIGSTWSCHNNKKQASFIRLLFRFVGSLYYQLVPCSRIYVRKDYHFIWKQLTTVCTSYYNMGTLGEFILKYRRRAVFLHTVTCIQANSMQLYN